MRALDKSIVRGRFAGGIGKRRPEEALIEQILRDSRSEARAVEALRELASRRWAKRVEEALEARTSSIRVVFDGPGTLGNAWACLRTMDCFGVQQAEAIDQEGADLVRLDSFEVVLRSQPWITVRRWRESSSCMAALRSEGYKILATDLAPGSVDFDELLPQLVESRSSSAEPERTWKIAVVIGNELDGISDATRELADWRAFLPMAGMSKSFNVSVACGVMLATLGFHGFLAPGNLDDSERAGLRLRWLLAACGDAERAEDALKAAAVADTSGSPVPTGGLHGCN